MTETQKRIVSALVMLVLVLIVMSFGAQASLGLVGIIGILVLDEIYTNFFEKNRNRAGYIAVQTIFILAYSYFNYVDVQPGIFQIFINAGIVLNFFLLVFLFDKSSRSKSVLNLIRQFSPTLALIMLIPFMSISVLFHQKSWITYVGLILLLNFSMDTGAWFFGKRFGKHKLWPVISPKKTIEGLIGGVFTSALVSILYWHLLIDSIQLSVIVLFVFLALCSQIGDLIQSKIKRQFEIKDSSSLIPGHGGVYDRIDSLLYVAPLFAVLLYISKMMH
jgi:phosphatidate cytidylyltransferase